MFEFVQMVGRANRLKTLLHSSWNMSWAVFPVVGGTALNKDPNIEITLRTGIHGTYMVCQAGNLWCFRTPWKQLISKIRDLQKSHCRATFA